jgi:hypothetical protein
MSLEAISTEEQDMAMGVYIISFYIVLYCIVYAERERENIEWGRRDKQTDRQAEGRGVEGRAGGSRGRR